MNRNYLSISILLFITAGLFITDLLLGSVSIPFEAVVDIISGNGDPEKASWQIIILDSRLPKAITAVICGIALSVSGLQMQTLFRNPLAGPYILGISSGAGLGVVLLTLGMGYFGLNYAEISGSWSLIIAAISGAGLVMVFIFMASLRVRDIMTVLILGVMLAAIINAVIGVFQFFSNADELKSFVIWTFGSLDAVSMDMIAILLPVSLLAVMVVFFFAKPLNLLLLGDAYAKSMGVNIIGLRIVIILTTAVLAGSITAFCGPIGFIGIVVPHICRLLFKTSDHRILIPTSALVGAIFMLSSDVISHLPGSDGILPVNSVTAILGIPFIIWMVFGNKVISKGF